MKRNELKANGFTFLGYVDMVNDEWNGNEEEVIELGEAWEYSNEIIFISAKDLD